jgi:uncharacterized protein YjbI with pentapeptide repeats
VTEDRIWRPAEILRRYEAGERVFRELDIEGLDGTEEFRGANLEGVEFVVCFISADFSGARLRGAKVSGNVKCCRFDGADLRGAEFVAAIDGATFDGADMEGASFEGSGEQGYEYQRGELPR